MRPLDLHALSTPPAFTLSQDQTLTIDRNFLSYGASRLSTKAPKDGTKENMLSCSYKL